MMDCLLPLNNQPLWLWVYSPCSPLVSVNHSGWHFQNTRPVKKTVMDVMGMLEVIHASFWISFHLTTGCKVFHIFLFFSTAVNNDLMFNGVMGKQNGCSLISFHKVMTEVMVIDDPKQQSLWAILLLLLLPHPENNCWQRGWRCY